MHRPSWWAIALGLYNRRRRMPAPVLSNRLVRAVAAERGQLDRRRAKLAGEAAELRRTLAHIEHGLVEIDERRALLDRVAPPATSENSGSAATPSDARAATDPASHLEERGDEVLGPSEARAATDPPSRPGEPGDAVLGDAARGATLPRVAPRRDVGGSSRAAPDSESDGASAEVEAAGAVLRGPRIREVAVRLLVERGTWGALHHRDWYALLVAAGYEIAGKDPLAVFLTQLTRSPAVRRSGAPGVYEVDRGASAREAARLAELQRELRTLTAAVPAADLTAIRAVMAEITRAERALAELTRVLGPAPAGQSDGAGAPAGHSDGAGAPAGHSDGARAPAGETDDAGEVLPAAVARDGAEAPTVPAVGRAAAAAAAGVRPAAVRGTVVAMGPQVTEAPARPAAAPAAVARSSASTTA
jgi:hypothetical protein